MTETNIQSDLIQIGVTPAADAVIQQLIERVWYSSEMGAFKAAVAYGLANGLAPTEGGGFQTKWHVGGLDRSGELIEVVSMFYDGERPWDYIRRIGDAALKHLQPRIEMADVPSDLFSSDGQG